MPEPDWMKLAAEQALCGMLEGGMPVGAVLVRGEAVLSKAHNHCCASNDPTAHAIMECIRQAGRVDYHNTVLYSTVMPCQMCAGTMVFLGIPRVVVGDSETIPGARQFLLEQGVRVDELDRPDVARLLQQWLDAKV